MLTAAGNVDVLSTVCQMPEDGLFFCNIQGRNVSQDETTTLLTRLSNLQQYPRHHIAILTDGMADKAWVEELLRKKYATQRATQLPVEHIVLDTLKNVSCLEPHVILFIIPQSFGRCYGGCLKKRLCKVTRTISRLELLLPWDPSQRQQDLEELKNAFLFPVSMFAIDTTL